MNFSKALFHNTGWKIIGLLFTFINNILIVRILGVAESGSFFYFLAFLTLLVVFLKLGVENGIVYHAAMQPEKSGSIFYLLIPLMIVQGIVAYIVIYYFQPQQHAYNNVWALGYVTSNIFFYYISAFYQAQKKFISINVINTIITFAQTILLFLLYKKNISIDYLSITDGILAMLTGTIILQMIVLCLYYFGSVQPIYKKSDHRFSVAIFRFSFVNYLITLILFLIARVDFYFVGKYCDETVLGNYTQIAKVAQMVLVIPGLFGGVIFPFSVHRHDKMEEKVALLCRMLSTLLIIVFSGIAIFGYYIFPWLFGEAFYLMYPGILTIFLGVYSLCISTLLMAYLEGKNKQWIIIQSFILVLCLVILGDYLLVPKYGYLAAAAVFSVANFIGLFFMIGSFSKISQQSFASLFFVQKKDMVLLFSKRMF